MNQGFRYKFQSLLLDHFYTIKINNWTSRKKIRHCMFEIGKGQKCKGQKPASQKPEARARKARARNPKQAIFFQAQPNLLLFTFLFTPYWCK